MPSIRQVFGREAPALGAQAFGVEVELENVHLADMVPGFLNPWRLEGDGSLRNGGIEFISPPCTYKDLTPMLERLWAERNKQNWTYGARCGVHVHMDFTERSVEELRNFLTLYAAMEPVIFDLCGADREQNIYCIPWYRTDGRDQAIIRRMLDAPTLANVRNVSDTCKYSALYTEPLRRFGTVEFRGAPVFERVGDMIHLVGTLDHMLAAAQEHTAEQILDMFEEDTRDAVECFMPGHGDKAVLLDQVDSIGSAMRFVRTNEQADDDWQFNGLDAEPIQEPEPEPVPWPGPIEEIRRLRQAMDRVQVANLWQAEVQNPWQVDARVEARPVGVRPVPDDREDRAILMRGDVPPGAVAGRWQRNERQGIERRIVRMENGERIEQRRPIPIQVHEEIR